MALYKAQVTFAQARGHLTIDQHAVRYAPLDDQPTTSPPPPVTLPISSIARTKQSKATAGAIRLLLITHDQQQHIFTFDNVDDRSRFRDTLSPLVVSTAGTGAAAAANAPAAPSAAMPDVRTARLAADASLRASYDELVTRSGILTPDDFWAQQNAAGVQQEEGFSSERIDLTRDGAAAAAPAAAATAGPSGTAFGATAHASGEVSITLTPRMIQEILTSEPAVRRSYLDNVPHAVSEKDFWTRYFRSKARKAMQQKVREGKAAAAPASAAPPDDELPAPSAARKRPLHPDAAVSVNEALPAPEGGGGYGLAEGSEPGSASNTAAAHGQRQRNKLLQQYNQHGEVVVVGRPTASASGAEVEARRLRDARREWVALPDLEDAVARQPLSLPEALSTATVPATGPLAAKEGGDFGESADAHSAEARARLAQYIGAWCASLTQLELPTAAVAGRVAAGAAAPRRAEPGAPPVVATTAPARVLEEELGEQMRRALELLRHFYACFPLAVHAGAKERAAKLHAAMLAQRAGLDALRQRLPRDNPALASAVLARINPLETLLQTGIGKYDAEVLSKAKAASVAAST